MKTIKHSFKGYGIWPSIVNIHKVTKDNIHYILFEDINEGTSVTNASEQLAADAVQLFGLHPMDCRFFETYSGDLETFDEIEYTWKEHTDHDHRGFEYPIFEAKQPVWKPAAEIRKMFIQVLNE